MREEPRYFSIRAPRTFRCVGRSRGYAVRPLQVADSEGQAAQVLVEKLPYAPSRTSLR